MPTPERGSRASLAVPMAPGRTPGPRGSAVLPPQRTVEPCQPQAALIYQHATADRDQAIAGALSEMAAKAAAVVPMIGPEQLGHVRVTNETESGKSQYPQRDSNPCCRLERAVS